MVYKWYKIVKIDIKKAKMVENGIKMVENGINMVEIEKKDEKWYKNGIKRYKNESFFKLVSKKNSTQKGAKNSIKKQNSE
jgi:hypothetical protein